MLKKRKIRIGTLLRMNARKLHGRKRRARGNSGPRRSGKKALARRLKVLALAVVSVTVAYLTILGFSFYKFSRAPFTTASVSQLSLQEDNELWDNEIVNILLIEVNDRNSDRPEIKNLVLASIDKPAKSYYFYQLPISIDVDYSMNLGRGPLKDIFRAAEDNDMDKISALQKTLFKYLAVSTHGYILTDDKSYQEITSQVSDFNPHELSAIFRIKNIPKLPSFLSSIRSNTETDISLGNFLNIMNFIKSTSETSSNIKNVNQYEFLDPYQWDILWQSRKSITAISKENTRVFVGNASKDPVVPGLAQLGSRVVNNLGAFTLETSNVSVNFKENTIITAKEDSPTVRELIKIFEIKNILSPDEFKEEDNLNSEIFRADVSLILINY